MTTYIVPPNLTSFSINFGDVIDVISGGVADNILINIGGTENVFLNGIATNTTINDYGQQNIYYGQANGTNINDGGYQDVLLNGIANNTTINSGGVQSLESLGTSNNTTISNNGIEIVSSGGVANNTLIENTGLLILLPGGLATNTSVNNGGNIVSSGVVLYQPQLGITFNPNQSIVIPLVANDKEYVLTAGSISSPIIDGGTLEITSGSTVNGSINFSSNGGELIIDPSELINNTISGFTVGDNIAISGVTYSANDSVSITSMNEVTLFTDTTNYKLNIKNVVPGINNFVFNSDSVLTEVTTPCFCSGSMILTNNGEIPVEKLSIGDSVITIKGKKRAIKWIGKRSYLFPFFQDSVSIIPILIKACALGNNVPNNDLYLSPLHALFIRDMLVPAGLIIDGVNITRCTDIKHIDYYHIELETHDIILANGTPVETFIDCDSRSMFENVNEFYSLYPDNKSFSWLFCAPRVESGENLRRIREHISKLNNKIAKKESNIRGELDEASEIGVRGWVWDQNEPKRRVEIEVMDGDCILARVVADQFRADLVKAGIGDGWHSFHIPLGSLLSPWSQHIISIREVGKSNTFGQTVTISSKIELNHFQLPQFSKALNTVLVNASSTKTANKMLIVLNKHAEQAKQLQFYRFNSLNKDQKRILFIDQRGPDKNRDAGSVAIIGHMKAFIELGYQIQFVAVHEDLITEENENVLIDMGVYWHRVSTGMSVESVLRINRDHLDLIYLHRLKTAQTYTAIARQICSKAKIIYSVADLHYLRIARQAHVQNRNDIKQKVEALRNAELQAVIQADCVITHSPVEAIFLENEISDIKVNVVRWPVQTNLSRSGFYSRKGIGFIGSGSHAPNADGLAWLIREIMPLVWKKNPIIEVHIAGVEWPTDMTKELDKRILFHGKVPVLKNFLARLRITVAPLRFGAGIKGKVLESFAAKVPCIMSQIASEGLDLDTNLQDLIALDQFDFAKKILTLYEDPLAFERLGKSGLLLIKRDNSLKAVTLALSKALSY